MIPFYKCRDFLFFESSFLFPSAVITSVLPSPIAKATFPVAVQDFFHWEFSPLLSVIFFRAFHVDSRCLLGGEASRDKSALAPYTFPSDPFFDPRNGHPERLFRRSSLAAEHVECFLREHLR